MSTDESMKSDGKNGQDTSTRLVNHITFHGLQLLVVENQGVEYVEAKPLCEFAGVQWRSARNSLQEGDSLVLYGTKRLDAPPIASAASMRGTLEGALYIRLDRSRMFMARINTDRMRSQGNAIGADQLLKLQIEWADVLHRYETHGIALKPGRVNTFRDLLALTKLRDACRHQGERKAYTALLHESLIAMGMPADALADQQLEFDGL